ncbi:MAG TPA: hypothetical protein VI385_06795 [Flavisolibacter sp.]
MASFTKETWKSNAPVKFLSYWFLLFLMLFFSTSLQAQVWINGHLRDKISNRPIVNGEIRSSLSNVLTDSNGLFRIQATEGDIISANKTGYRFDTVHFSFHNYDSTLVIKMEPLGSVMKTVTVKTSYSAYQVDSMRRRMAFDEGRSKTTFVSKEPHAGFGLVFNLDRLSKSNDKHLKKQREIFEKAEQWAYIRSRFSDSIVRNYTGLTGDSLHLFMKQYTPSYEWLRDHPSKIELIYYLNESMKDFQKGKR